MIVRELYKEILKVITGKEWTNKEYSELEDKIIEKLKNDQSKV
jgi:hypothetical protein